MIMETLEAFRMKQLNELLKEADPKEWVILLAGVIEGLAFGIDAVPDGDIQDAIKEVVTLQKFFIRLQRGNN